MPYILPLLMFSTGYALGLRAWIGGLAFLLAMVSMVVYDRRVSAREKSVYTIIGYWEEPHTERKGDN